MYGNGGSFYTIDRAVVTAGEEYELSYWYKGKLTKSIDSNEITKNITVSVDWYDGVDNPDTGIYSNMISSTKFTLDSDKVITDEDKWQEKKFTVRAPTGAKHAEIKFKIWRGGGYVLIDDVTLIPTKEPVVQIPTPNNVQADVFQREITLNWEKPTGEGITWEVLVNEQEPAIKTTTNSLVLDNLAPNTLYNIKVRAVKENNHSEYKIISQKTKALNFEENNQGRVPYLRTLSDNVTTSKELSLYFTDLANKNAKISYFLNNVEIKPANDKKLHFTQTGEQKFKVVIEEAPDKIWETEYNLTINNN